MKHIIRFTNFKKRSRKFENILQARILAVLTRLERLVKNEILESKYKDCTTEYKTFLYCQSFMIIKKYFK